MATHEYHNLRWATDRNAGGTWRAYAYTVHGETTADFGDEGAGATESEALEALRKNVCRTLRLSADTEIINARGDRIKVGGGHR